MRSRRTVPKVEALAASTAAASVPDTTLRSTPATLAATRIWRRHTGSPEVTQGAEMGGERCVSCRWVQQALLQVWGITHHLGRRVVIVRVKGLLKAE